MADTKTDDLSPEASVDFLYSVIGVSLPIQLLFVGGRYYARLKIHGNLGIDDSIIGLASIASLALSIMGLIAHSYSNNGQTPQELNGEYAPHYGQLAFGFNLLFPIACSLPKISLSITYLRLFPTKSNARFCHIMMIIVACWCLSTMCTTIFQCTPVTAEWSLDRTKTKKSCIDVEAALLATAAINTFTDFAVYIWPTRTLWHVQLPTRQRVGLLCVFCLGSIVCIAGIVRMWYIASFYQTDDQLHLTAIVWVVSVVQANVGVVCGCLHSVKAVLATLVPTLFAPTAGVQVFSRSKPPRILTFPFRHKKNPRTTKLTTMSDKGFDSFSKASRPSDRDSRLPHRPSTAVTGKGPAPADAMGFEAWVTSGNPDELAVVPEHGIACTTEVVVDRGSQNSSPTRDSISRRPSDSEADSLDLILPPNPAKCKDPRAMLDV
ncbi:hypothetical protein EJ05DRAFT_227068 [Pseudovirgaria hyperparasitica]|uniref:Rhodopsin domain-containing protein n=1 Tax=Pseudovirgaria hyperparasitica TaxID=470096 RepID=A0A6A6VSF3_9PEZI|nr:uncharacterized protein EJ05DRAFT_227068 [Pseudovirgaria hyperparasitica]KAF2753153.1 hypothetical protein EJ05DRAFT_227068 [Pseudovirgaria hyperparasitica]